MNGPPDVRAAIPQADRPDGRNGWKADVHHRLD